MRYSRYIVFAGVHYYPCGGLRDVSGHCGTLDEARDHVKGLFGEPEISVRTSTRKECGEPYKIERDVEYTWVSGPDWWHVLDLETGDEVTPFELGMDYIVGGTTERVLAERRVPIAEK